jgi:CTP synthase
MRLGAYPCRISKGSKAFEAYKTQDILERHRHRFELNNTYIEDLKKHGMIATGINLDTDLVEIVELESHPWFIGVQFHPEYKSTVVNPHPLFVAFVKAALLLVKQGSFNISGF